MVEGRNGENKNGIISHEERKNGIISREERKNNGIFIIFFWNNEEQKKQLLARVWRMPIWGTDDLQTVVIKGL